MPEGGLGHPIVLSHEDEVGTGESSGPGCCALSCGNCRRLFRIPFAHVGRPHSCACGAPLPEAPPSVISALENMERSLPRSALETMDPGESDGLDADLPEKGKVVLGKYEVVEEIARGGMGVIFRARQVGVDREVALKMLLAGAHAGEEMVQRFLREAESAARLSHPNIVPVYDVGLEQGKYFYAMSFVRGESLADLLSREGPLEAKRALRLVRDTARALHFAHHKGIVHRDIKPANIMIQDLGASDLPGGRSMLMGRGADSTEKVLVADFGLAKDMGEAERITLSGTALGTPVYMSPEQARGDMSQVGPLSDVYSLGAVLYETVTGREPFSGDNVAKVLGHVIGSEPTAPRKIKPSLHRDVETVILKAMNKIPQRRYVSAEAFAEDADLFLQGRSIKARPPGPVERVMRALSRHRKLTGSVGAFLLVAAISLGWLWSDHQQRARRLESEFIDLVARGFSLSASGRFEEGERILEQAAALKPEHAVTRNAIAYAQALRLYDRVRSLLTDGKYKDAGLILTEAETVLPGHAEGKRLARLVEGTALLSVNGEASGDRIWFGSLRRGVLWTPGAVPLMGAAAEAGMFRSLGEAPFGPADHPFGTGWVLLQRNDAIVDLRYVAISRNGELRLDLRRRRVEAGLGGNGADQLRRALASAVPGMTLELGGGSYAGPFEITVPCLTVKAAPGATVDVACAKGPVFSAKNVFGICLEGFRAATESGPVIAFEACPGLRLRDLSLSGQGEACLALQDCPDAMVGRVRVGNCPGIAIHLRACPGSTLWGNRVTGAGKGGIFVGSSARVSAWSNVVQGAGAWGIFVQESPELILRENVLLENGQFGIFVQDCTGTLVIEQNLITRTLRPPEGQSAIGIMAFTADRGRISKNTVYDNLIGIRIGFGRSVACVNNIVAKSMHSGIWTHYVGEFDHNCLWQNRLGIQFFNTVTTSLEELRELSKADGREFMVHGFEADPMFQDPENGVFALRPGSPCLGTGKDGADMGADWEIACRTRDGDIDPATSLRRENGIRLRNLARDSERENPRAALEFARWALAIETGRTGMTELIERLERRLDRD